MHLLPQGGNATLPCRARARNVAKVVHAHVHHAQVGAAQRQRYRTTHRMNCASTTELGWLALMPERVAGDWALAIGACAVCWMRKDGPWALRVQGDSACWRVEHDLHFVAPGPSSREDHRDALNWRGGPPPLPLPLLPRTRRPPLLLAYVPDLAGSAMQHSCVTSGSFWRDVAFPHVNWGRRRFLGAPWRASCAEACRLRAAHASYV